MECFTRQWQARQPLSAAGVFSGTPNLAGNFSFTVTTTDNNGDTGTRQYTLVVSPGGTITVNPFALPGGTVGVGYNQKLTATGGTGPYNFTAIGTLPPGLTLTTSGVLAGTPTTGGSFTF